MAVSIFGDKEQIQLRNVKYSEAVLNYIFGFIISVGSQKN